ncbi:unnamed protein product [Ectocarpus fasciculatus]
MTTVRAVGAKRPRGYVAAAEEPTLPWAGRVPKPAMDADSFVDYGSGFLRKSCDSCVSSKRRCDGQDPCTRCLRRKKPCHYTERKKCGPRSGQKTGNGARRQPASTSPPDCAGSSGADARKQRRQFMEYQQRALRTQQQQRAAVDGLAGAPASAPGSRYPAMAHGRPLPPHAPMLATGELSGETTCVDHTDYSDNGLPPRVLSRDESGSSWWSLDDQGGAGAAVSGRLSGVPAPIPSSSWPQREHHQQHHHQEQQHQGGNNDFSNDGAGVEHYGQRTGLWGGLRPGSAAGTGSGSGGSTGESWDDESEEGQGRDEEEEVAALLLGLGKTTNEDFEGFSDDDEEPAPERPVRPGGVGMFREPRHLPVSNASQELSV